jgi:hypothetical protein
MALLRKHKVQLLRDIFPRFIKTSTSSPASQRFNVFLSRKVLTNMEEQLR